MPANFLKVPPKRTEGNASERSEDLLLKVCGFSAVSANRPGQEGSRLSLLRPLYIVYIVPFVRNVRNDLYLDPPLRFLVESEWEYSSW
jgi:hypothetical protein